MTPMEPFCFIVLHVSEISIRRKNQLITRNLGLQRSAFFSIGNEFQRTVSSAPTSYQNILDIETSASVNTDVQ